MDENKVREILDRTIEVYEVRDPKVTAERYEKKRQSIEWIMQEFRKGPIQGGTRADTDSNVWNFGSSEWDAVRDSIRCIYDDKCAICGQPAREVHHIRPRFLNGRNHPRNLILLCNDCHDEVHRKIDEGIQKVLEESLEIKPLNRDSLNKWMD